MGHNSSEEAVFATVDLAMGGLRPPIAIQEARSTGRSVALPDSEIDPCLEACSSSQSEIPVRCLVKLEPLKEP